uniref:Uncharacterized protein n=1 Tax=Arundo donax TaxID=35708 RepID=A0A0A9D5M9_ARUDO
MMNMERWRCRTPFSISVRIRSSTFFLILPIPLLLAPPAAASGERWRV